ncbi:hypothetical protein [Clostridium tunisiense]|uniref:hypothetical protein n=1 Tax=Clostridium tunisiense TaxID=219748 RepID=UPI000312E0AB|nr:hypothetical protein [Clostridium tunisiense]
MNKKIKKTTVILYLLLLLLSLLLGLVWFLSPLSGFMYDKQVEITITFIGSLIGGITTLIALWISTNETRKIQEENRKDQNNLIILKEKKEFRTNAFIIENDLKICFKDLFNILVQYSLDNAKPDMKKEERIRAILSWKEILRGINYSSSWRAEIRTLSSIMKMDDLNYIYEMYTLLEKSKQFLNLSENNKHSYVEVHRNIELIPKEFVFNEKFLEDYSNLKYCVEEHDYYVKIYEFDHNKPSTPGMEPPPKVSLEEKEDLKVNIENLKYIIYSSKKVFEDIREEQENNHLKYYDFLNDKWKSIFKELHEISNDNN